MKWGATGRDTDLIDLIVPDNWPAPPGHTRHAGQGDPGRLNTADAPPPGTRRRPHVHKSIRYGVVFVGAGQPCEYCAAQLEGGRA